MLSSFPGGQKAYADKKGSFLSLIRKDLSPERSGDVFQEIGKNVQPEDLPAETIYPLR